MQGSVRNTTSPRSDRAVAAEYPCNTRDSPRDPLDRKIRSVRGSALAIFLCQSQSEKRKIPKRNKSRIGPQHKTNKNMFSAGMKRTATEGFQTRTASNCQGRTVPTDALFSLDDITTRTNAICSPPFSHCRTARKTSHRARRTVVNGIHVPGTRSLAQWPYHNWSYGTTVPLTCLIGCCRTSTPSSPLPTSCPCRGECCPCPP